MAWWNKRANEQKKSIPSLFCLQSMAQSSAAGLSASIPGGCLSLHTCRLMKKRGQIQPCSPSTPSAASLLGLWAGGVCSPPLGQRSCGIPLQDSIQGQQRPPWRELKLCHWPGQATVRQQLCPWHLSWPWPEHGAHNASTKRDGGLETATHSGWTHGLAFLDVETKPGPCLIPEHPMWTSIHSAWALCSEGAEEWELHLHLCFQIGGSHVWANRSPLLCSNHLSGSLPQCLCVCSGVGRELPTSCHSRLPFAFSLLHSPQEYFGSLPPVAEMQVLDYSHGEPGTENKEILGCLGMKMRLEGIWVRSSRVFRYQEHALGSKKPLFPLSGCWRMLSRDWSRIQTRGQTGNVCLLETSAILLCFSYDLPKYISCTFAAQNSLLWGLIRDV